MTKKRQYYYDEGSHGRVLEELNYALWDVVYAAGEDLRQTYPGRLLIWLLDLTVTNDE